MHWPGRCLPEEAPQNSALRSLGARGRLPLGRRVKLGISQSALLALYPRVEKTTAYFQGFTESQSQPFPRCPHPLPQCLHALGQALFLVSHGNGCVTNLRGVFLSEVFSSVIGDSASSRPAIYCHMSFRRQGPCQF